MTRPIITFCFAMSIDGKISTVERRTSALASREDRRRLDRLRAEADVLLVGAETVRREDPPFAVQDANLIQQRLARGKSAHPDLCILSRSGALPGDRRAFTTHGQRVFLASVEPPGASVPPSTIWVPVADPFSPETLLASTVFFNCERLLVEGGGRVNAFFAEADLVDEIRLTLAPLVLGGLDAPTPVEGRGLPFARRLSFKLVSCDREAEELYLHYVRTPSTALFGGRVPTGKAVDAP